MSEVTDYLKLIADFRPERDGWAYTTYEGLVLAEGKLWGPKVSIRPSGPMKQCFCNAWHAAHDNGWTYVEGYTANIIPVAHAWCADNDGNVIETTWPDRGTEYWGVALDVEWVNQRVAQTGYWGVFGNDWIKGATLLKDGLPREAHASPLPLGN